MTTNEKRFIMVVLLLGILGRIIPHPPNFTPILSMGLFCGGFLSRRRFAFGLPLLCMLLSDLVIGFYPGMMFTYLSIAMAIFLGSIYRPDSVKHVLVNSLAVSLSFFVLSNLGVFMFSGMYPLTGSGLLTCYTAALPFFQNTLMSTVGFSLLFLFAVQWILFQNKTTVSTL